MGETPRNFGGWTRRQALGRIGAALGAAFFPFSARGYGLRSYFVWAQLRYPGAWDPNPLAAGRFLRELARRTSVEPAGRRRVIDPADPALFELPFLYVAGRLAPPRLGPAGEEALTRYLEHGGFVLFDDATGVPDSGFARGVEELLERVMPGRRLRPLPADHTVYQSFYLLSGAPGRVLVKPFLYGVDREDLTPAILVVNDLGGAWDADPVAGFTHACVPGGERQRELAFRLGVNLVLYALTGNYKKDQVHIPFILRRRQRP
ncbi:DUF4159 domain-containing protein [Deferrisoma sp.]